MNSLDRVLTVHDYYDGPRLGVTELNGVPHIYEAEFDYGADEYADTYFLSPIAEELLALILEDWQIWLRWERESKAGRASPETHPALPSDRAKHERLLALIGDRLKTDPQGRKRYKATFSRSGPGPISSWYGVRVQWVPQCRLTLPSRGTSKGYRPWPPLMSNVRHMNEVKEDLSGPYESWATSRLAVSRRKARPRPAVLAILGATLAVAGLNAWVLVADVLHPLWNRPPGYALLYALAVPIAGVFLLFISSVLKWRHKSITALGLCFVVPLTALPFAPLVLYVNQSGDPNDLACYAYKVSKKKIVRVKGYAYDVTFLSATGAEKTLRISRRQFDLLSEGATVWLQIGNGLLGVSYVKQIAASEVSNCSNT